MGRAKADALVELHREPDPLSAAARGQLVAKAIRAYASGVPEQLPLKEVPYLGSNWPEFAALLDEVQREIAEPEKASA